MCQLREHTAGGARVGERRRAHLHGRGAGQEQLDRVDPARHATDAHDRQIAAAPRGRRGRPARRPGGWRDPTGRRPPPPSTGRRVSGSIAMPSTVFIERDAPRRPHRPPRRRPRRAIGGRAQLGPPRPPARRGRRRRPPRCRGGVGEHVRPPSRFGHDRFTSTATTAGPAPASSSAASRYSPTVRPQMLATTRRPWRAAGQFVGEPRRHAGALQPDRVEHPGGVVQAGRGLPGHGTAASDFTTTRRASRGRVADRARRRGRRCPTPSSPGWAAVPKPTATEQVDVRSAASWG